MNLDFEAATIAENSPAVITGVGYIAPLYSCDPIDIRVSGCNISTDKSIKQSCSNLLKSISISFKLFSNALKSKFIVKII